MTIRRRRRTRSSQTPAGSEKSRCGRSPTAVSRPICAALGVEDQDGDDRQREERDLVAEDRDRLADPEAPEVVLAQQRRRKAREGACGGLRFSHRAGVFGVAPRMSESGDSPETSGAQPCRAQGAA